MDPEVYRKALQAELLQHLEGKKVDRVLHVIIRLQAYVRRRQARRKVMRMREQQVVQHYMDPSVQKLKPTGLYLQQRAQNTIACKVLYFGIAFGAYFVRVVCVIIATSLSLLWFDLLLSCLGYPAFALQGLSLVGAVFM
ncbi:unnamed protein product [Symbiodinium sp. CCMP2592]|nr:unnamed protein product [Symbiodinium sp. CCMP2592]